MENDNTRVIVLGCKKYDFTDENGRRVSGTKVFFTVPEQEEKNALGYIPKEANLPLQAFDDMQKLQYPFEANLITTSWFGAKKVQTRISSFEYLSNLQFS